MRRRTLDQLLRFDSTNNRVSSQPDFAGLRDPLVAKLAAAQVSSKHHHVNGGHPNMSNSDTRASLIDGVCQQDHERWRQFDAIYRPMLMEYLKKRRLPDCDANDVVQDIFVKLLTKIRTYDRAKCSFRSWLFSVAHNALIDHARRVASRKRALDAWVIIVLRATPSDSVGWEGEWTMLHRERILKHCAQDRSCAGLPQGLGLLRGADPEESARCRDRPRTQARGQRGLRQRLPRHETGPHGL